jgi:hypothetical protein
LVGFFAAGFAAGLGLVLCMGGADHTRFNASLKGIAGTSSFESLRGLFMVVKVSVPPPDIEYAAIGRFICECNDVEANLHRLLQWVLAIDEPIERILVGEPRIGDLVDLVKKAAALKGWVGPKLALLTRIAGIINQNNKIRQIVAHKPALIIRGKHLLFHNSSTAKNQRAFYTYECTHAELNNQTTLLLVVSAALQGFTQLEKVSLAFFLRMYNERLTSLENNPRPAIPSQPPPPKLPKQQRQRRASRA